ncbi:MAG: tetratricopeptide repeat protein [Maribacter sp.]|nr:tetratricopeptide repeat protein [Maribacter sp.]
MNPSFEEHINNAELFLRENELDKSIRYYEEALNLASTIQEKIDLHNVLGRLFQKTGNYKKSISHFEASLDLYDNFPETDYLGEKAVIFNNIGAVHIELDIGKAIQNYKSARTIYTTLTTTGDKAYYPHLANTEFALAEAYLEKNDFFNAKKNYREAIKVYEQIPDYASAELKASAYYQLGNIYTEEFNLFDARVNYSKSLVLLKDLSLKDEKSYTPILAAVLNNLGVTYKTMGEHQKALDSYEETLKLYQNLANQNVLFLPYVAATTNSLSIVHAELGNHERAMDYGRDTIAVYNGLTDTNPDEYTHYLATSLHNLGLFGFELKKFDLAEEYFEQALAIRRSLALKQSEAFDADFCATALNLVELYHVKMESKLAIKRKTKCLELLHDVDGRLQRQDEDRPVLRSMKSDCRYYLDYFTQLGTD